MESGDREVVALIKGERLAGRPPITHGGVVGQIWRGGAGSQAPVARLLNGIEVRDLDTALGKRAGVLLGATGTSDVVDSALVCLAVDGDVILTSDPGDLVDLARKAGTHVELFPLH